MIIQASLEVLQLLEKLFKDWLDWEQNRSYYLYTLLPELKANEDCGSRQEKAIFHELKHVATPEEWLHLESIAEDFSGQQKRIREISRTLDRFFDQGDFLAAEVYYSANQGTAVQRLFETKKHGAIEIVLRASMDALNKFEFEQAEVKVISVKQFLLDTEIEAYQTLLKKQQEKFIDKIIRDIERACTEYNYILAESLYKKVSHSFPKDAFIALVDNAKQRQVIEERAHFVSVTIVKIQELLEQYDFVNADEKYVQIKEEYSEETYQKLVQTCKNKQVREGFILSIYRELEAGSFSAADQIFRSSVFVSYDDYLQIKSPFIGKYIQSQYSREINDEKSSVLSDISQNHLISARAGSGKTSVLAFKAGMLMDCDKINPDHILVLAFNKKAAAEIRGRIQKEMKFHNFENARTFHGLAYQLTNPKETLLFDDGEEELSRPALSNFVQDLLRGMWTPNLQEKIYAFFRKEITSVQRVGALLNDKEYFLYIRSQRDITLGGGRVKSTGEKYLADFLFEHDIPYSYESLEFWAGHNYHPDFSLYNHKITIEFWGIDENDSNKHAPAWWDMTWQQYRDQMIEKRAYWREKNIPLIEFSVADLRGGRESFEAIIKKRLLSAGVVCEKLPQLDLEKRVVRNQIDRLTSLFVQFIQKAKKQMWSSAHVQERLRAYKFQDERERIFLQLASRIYEDYQIDLAKRNAIDFDDLMMQAAALIDKDAGECEISLGVHKDRSVKMNDLKWILIDEYQDFSALFFNIIQSIRKHNPQVNLLCVGDDWQAINSFAGSDLTYFKNFNDMFPGQQTSLLTNFRSQKAVVEGGNAVMQGLGKPGMPLMEKQGGVITQQSVNDVWIEWREGESYSESRKDDDRFVFYEKRESGLKVNDNGFINARYLKACYQIITEKDNWQKITSAPTSKKDKIRVAILSRTNYMERATLSEFERKLHACFSAEEKKQLGDPREKIRTGTAHGFKGLEADIVIILRANEGAFPLIHPDNALFKFFGQTEKDILDEERRLFYVAVTRAAEKLYILTENERESPFLKDLIS